jgi:putative iron-dependent peroxidase
MQRSKRVAAGAAMAGRTTGVRDALTRYTRPVSGAYYFVPSIEALRRYGPVDS